MYRFQRIYGEKDKAITAARTEARKNKSIRLFESPSGRFILTNGELEWREIPYATVNLRAVREYDVETTEEVREILGLV